MAKVEGFSEGFLKKTTINQQTVKSPTTRNHRLVNTFQGVVICFVGTRKPSLTHQGNCFHTTDLIKCKLSPTTTIQIKYKSQKFIEARRGEMA